MEILILELPEILLHSNLISSTVLTIIDCISHDKHNFEFIHNLLKNYKETGDCYIVKY